MSQELIRKTASINGVDVVSTGELGKLLGMNLSVEFISQLGEVKPFCVAHVGTYWRTEHVPLIGMAVAKWLIVRASDFQHVLNNERDYK